MKRLIAGLYIVFGLLLAGTIAIAVRSYDGPVVERYSLRGEEYLSHREREEALGLSIRVPDRIAAGINRFAAVLSTSAGPFRDASVSIRAMRIFGPSEDRTVSLREDPSGVYTGDLPIPVPGTWMLSLHVQRDPIDTLRTWTVVADGQPGAADRFAAGIHAGPVRGTVGSQAVILEVEPRPVRAMTDLRFTVHLPGYTESSPPHIDLSMPGMRMPPNRVELARGPDGGFHGTGVIVRCRSGKRTWRAAVTVPGKGTTVFTFDVVL